MALLVDRVIDRVEGVVEILYASLEGAPRRRETQGRAGQGLATHGRMRGGAVKRTGCRQICADALCRSGVARGRGGVTVCRLQNAQRQVGCTGALILFAASFIRMLYPLRILHRE